MISDTPDDVDELFTADGKNKAAMALGRLGGLKGGHARAAKLSADDRSRIARDAARARWQQGAE